MGKKKGGAKAGGGKKKKGGDEDWMDDVEDMREELDLQDTRQLATASAATEALAPVPSAKKKKKAGGGSGPMKVLLTHKKDKHNVEIPSPAMTCLEFAELISNQTGVPVASLKLIYRGKTLDSSSSKPVTTLKLKSNPKIMVLGKTHSPEEEAVIAKFNVERDAIHDIAGKLDALEIAAKDVNDGFVDAAKLRETAVEKHGRDLLFQSLQLEKVLTRLDGISLPAGDTELRTTRKAIVKTVQVQLDRTDTIDAVLKGSAAGGEADAPVEAP